MLGSFIACLLMIAFTLVADTWLPQNIPGWIGRILLGGGCIFLSVRYLAAARRQKKTQRGKTGKKK